MDREFAQVLKYGRGSSPLPPPHPHLCGDSPIPPCPSPPQLLFPLRRLAAASPSFSRYNKRVLDGRVDFRRVYGLDGIYVANRYNDSTAKFAQTVITYNKVPDHPPPPQSRVALVYHVCSVLCRLRASRT